MGQLTYLWTNIQYLPGVSFQIHEHMARVNVFRRDFKRQEVCPSVPLAVFRVETLCRCIGLFTPCDNHYIRI